MLKKEVARIILHTLPMRTETLATWSACYEINSIDACDGLDLRTRNRSDVLFNYGHARMVVSISRCRMLVEINANFRYKASLSEAFTQTSGPAKQIDY